MWCRCGRLMEVNFQLPGERRKPYFNSNGTRVAKLVSIEQIVPDLPGNENN